MALKIGVLPVTPFQQNCALLWDDTTMKGAIVDPGGNVPQLLAAIQKTGIILTGIYLTHGHVDHAGGATELSEATGVPIIGPHLADKFLLDGLAAQAAAYGLEGQNVAPDRWLEEGQHVTLGGVKFEVRHCPGHTPGHLVFLDLAGGFGIFGDVLFQGSIGRTDLGNYGSHTQLITAIKEKLLPLPDDFNFICGHGPGSTIGHERKFNPYLSEFAEE